MKHMFGLIGFVVLLTGYGYANSVYHVSPGGDDEAPGWSWETAKATIQAAVDAARDGDTVLVSNGVYSTGGAITPGYSLTNRVCATNAITIMSVSDDPTATVIVGASDVETGEHGSNAVRCVYLDGGAKLSGFTLTGGHTMTNRNFYQDSGGGGLFMHTGSVVSNCVIATNSAAWNGGGVVGYEGGTITHCEVITNVTAFAGGGVFLYYGGNVHASRLHGNVAQSAGSLTGSGGGGIFYLADPPNTARTTPGVFSDLVIDGNFAYGVGGGIHWYRGHCRALNCIVTNNVARGGSGGIYAWIDGTITNCYVAHNKGLYYSTGAGGVYLYYAHLTHSVIADNYTAAYGGGVYNRGTSSSVNNCLIVGNTAQRNGGGIYNSGIVRNSTIANNRVQTANQGGGVGFSGASGRLLQNSIVWGNSASNVTFSVPGPEVSYTCSYPLLEGEENIADNPRFVNPASGNYRLGSGSPCIDSGLLENWMAAGSDLDGQPRLRGATVDLGCYEHFVRRTILLLR